MEYFLFLFLILFGLGCVSSEISLRFVFIIEHQQPELSSTISVALHALEQDAGDMSVDGDVILLDREHEDESYRMLCSALSKGVSTIVDLSWSPWQAAQDVTSEAGVPLVRLQLGSQRLLAALDGYLEGRNATDAAILVDTEAEVDQTLYQLLGSSNLRVWVHAGLNRDTARALSAMRPEPNHYVLLGDKGFIRDAYSRAVKEKLVRHANRWTLVFTDTPASQELEQLVTATVVLHAEECCRMTRARDSCDCPRDQRPQLLLTSALQHLTEMLSKLEQPITARVDCQDVTSQHNGTAHKMADLLAEEGRNNDSMFYWDADRSTLSPRSRFVFTAYSAGGVGGGVFASWSEGERYRLLPGAVLPPLRVFYRIGTAEAVPWSMRKASSGADGAPEYEGYCIDLIARLAETMDFDYELVIPKHGTFGSKLPNGTWDGVVGDLMRGETDMAVGALTMTAEREEVIDFVPPYFEQTGILIVIRKPSRKTSLFKFMTVLRGEVWASVVCALALTGTMIWLLDKYSPYSARNNAQAYPYPCRQFTLKESFWFALTSFTPQGGGEAPKALSGRALVAAYWLFVVLMLATFTANLAAFLTVERMQSPVSSLEQLARQSRINYTVVEGSSVHQYFINMKFAEDTLYRVWKEITLNATSDQSQYRVWDYPIREQYGHILLAINASGPVPDARTGFEQVNEHTDADFAFIHDSAEIRYEISRNCNLTEVGSVFAEQPYALAVQQGSRLQELLSRALLDLQKERLLEHLSQQYWNETARQSCPDADESEGITLESLGGVFIATLFGLGLAMLTLAWEVFYYKRKERNKLTEKKPQAFKKESKMAANKMAAVTKLRKRIKGGKISKVTIGDSFKPVDKVSVISVYPKREYHP